MGRCDFCFAPDPPWSFPTTTGTPWAACTTCKRMIEADDYVRLLTHVMAESPTVRAMGVRNREPARRNLARLYDLFREQRNGPPSRLLGTDRGRGAEGGGMPQSERNSPPASSPESPL